MPDTLDYFDRVLGSREVSLERIIAVREALKHLGRKVAQCKRHLAYLLKEFSAAIEPDANSEPDPLLYQNMEYGDTWLDPVREQ